MTAVPGKRKRRSEMAEPRDAIAGSSEDEAAASAAARALFQRAFEAKFKPLAKDEESIKHTKDEHLDELDLESDNGDWVGLPDEEQIEVIQVRDPDSNSNDALRSRELKAFMSDRIPTSTAPLSTTTTKAKVADDEAEAVNFKNDVALQRLLKESHLLDASTYSSHGGDVHGKSRLKALDLRIQDLGGKTSHLAQKKMPLSHRKGIEAKNAERERKRRTEATQNGIILEKAKLATKTMKPREKSIGGPNIGKFRGGMLKLSGRDLRSIESARGGIRKKSRGR